MFYHSKDHKTLPDFTFNPKTGEISRNGRARILPALHAQIIACLVKREGWPVTHATLAIECGVKVGQHGMTNETQRLSRRLAPLGLSLRSVPGKGIVIAAHDVPKWQPTIPPVQELQP